MNKNELTLLSYTQADRDGLFVLEKYGTKASISDLCKLTGCKCFQNPDMSNSSLILTKEPGVCINADGVVERYYCDDKKCCVRPVLNSTVFLQLKKNKVLGYNHLLNKPEFQDELNKKLFKPDYIDMYEVEYGEYPQYAAPAGIQKILESKFNRGLPATGRKYEFYSTLEESKVNKGQFYRTYNCYDEYEYDNKKYIRVISRSDEVHVKLSNGIEYQYGSPVWVEVSPVKWLVDEGTNTLISKIGLVAGIKYNNDDDLGFNRNINGIFENTEMYSFLNNKMSKDLFHKGLVTMDLDEVKKILNTLKNQYDLMDLSRNKNIDEEVMYYLFNESRDFRINRNLASNEKCPKRLLIWLSQSYDQDTRYNARNNKNFPKDEISNYNIEELRRTLKEPFVSEEEKEKLKYYELYESNPAKRKSTLSELDRMSKIELEKELLNSQKKEEEKMQKALSNIENARLEILEQLSIIDTNSSILSSNDIKKIKIPKEELIIDAGGYKEINEKYKEFLSFIDLSFIEFDDVYIKGIDFSKTNARIDLQTIYGKDASNCIFDNFNISDFQNYNDVNICGTRLNKKYTEGMANSTYDENTIITDGKLIDIINEKKGEMKI